MSTKSLQIVSNSKNKNGGTNYNNDFTMSLLEPIDAESQDVYIEVLNVNYPLTIKNIENDSDCYIELKITGDETQDIFNFSFDSSKMPLVAGGYNLTDILYSLNLFLSDFDCRLITTQYGRVGLCQSNEIELWYSITSDDQNSIYNTTQTIDNENWSKFQQQKTTTKNISIETIFSSKLAGMLGFENQSYKSEQGEKVTMHLASYLPDPTYGLNKLYIYCDQLELSIIGDTKSELLCIVPIEDIEKMSSGGLASYQPHTTKKNLQNL